MPSKRKEIRVVSASRLEVRGGSGGEPVRITGYAAVFNSWSDDLGGFVERIAPGAFRKALKKSDVRCLFNHDPNYVLGRTASGTLELREDAKGLFMECSLSDSPTVRDLVLKPIERGDLSQMSFAFNVGKDKWDDVHKSVAKRTIIEIKELFDVSPVTYPAYSDTSVAARASESAREILKKARNAGNNSIKGRKKMRFIRLKRTSSHECP